MALLLIFSVLFLYCFPLLFMLGLNTFFRLFTVFFCPVFLIMAIWFISAVLRVVDSSLYFLSPHSSLPPHIVHEKCGVFTHPPLYILPALLARVCLLERRKTGSCPHTNELLPQCFGGGGGGDIFDTLHISGGKRICQGKDMVVAGEMFYIRHQVFRLYGVGDRP